MYYKNSRIEDIKEKLSYRLEYARAAADAWSKVVIKRKKDGDEFANVKRAIEGASIDNCYDLSYLTVFFRAKGRYERDEFLTYGYIDELPEDDPRRAGKPLSEGCIRTKYDYTAEELRQMVAARIEHFRESIAEYEADFEVVEEATAEYRDAVKAAEARLAERCSKSLCYIITEAY